MPPKPLARTGFCQQTNKAKTKREPTTHHGPASTASTAVEGSATTSTQLPLTFFFPSPNDIGAARAWAIPVAAGGGGPAGADPVVEGVPATAAPPGTPGVSTPDPTLGPPTPPAPPTAAAVEEPAPGNGTPATRICRSSSLSSLFCCVRALTAKVDSFWARASRCMSFKRCNSNQGGYTLGVCWVSGGGS